MGIQVSSVDKLGMVDHIFLKGIAGVVHVIDTDVYIRRIDFAAALTGINTGSIPDVVRVRSL